VKKRRCSGECERITVIKRRAGGLRELGTSAGSTFLVLKNPRTERFLEVGTVLGRRDMEKLGGECASAAGLAFSYGLLSRRDRTESEIRTRLAGEGIVAPEIVEGILETLRRQGYLDDRRFAADFIRHRIAHRPSGPHLLRQKLMRFGVEEGIIDSEIGRALPLEREREIALELARRRFDTRIERRRAVRRVHGLLSRRGFSSGVVNEICSGLLREKEIHGDR
jgi:regulatory protein